MKMPFRRSGGSQSCSVHRSDFGSRQHFSIKHRVNCWARLVLQCSPRSTVGLLIKGTVRGGGPKAAKDDLIGKILCHELSISAGEGRIGYTPFNILGDHLRIFLVPMADTT